MFTEPKRFALLTLAVSLTLVPDTGHAHADECFNKGILTICPFPAFLGPGQKVKVEIICDVGSYGNMYKQEVGKLVGSNRYKATGYRFNDSATPTYKEAFTLFSNHSLSMTNTTLTLTLWPASPTDLKHEWYCGLQYYETGTIRFYQSSKFMHALPYPINTTLTVSDPVKPTYNASESEIASIECRGLSTLIGNEMKYLKLTFTFQTWRNDNWIDTLNNDEDRFIGQQNRDGPFNRQLYIFKLSTSSINGCSGRYRCLQSYNEKRFEEEAPELVLNVTQCTGSCLPPEGKKTCKGIVNKNQGGNDTNDGDDGIKKERFSLSSNWFLVLSFSILGSVAICALLIAAVVIFSKRRRPGPEVIMVPVSASVVATRSVPRHSFSTVSSHQPAEYSASFASDSHSYVDDASQFTEASSMASSTQPGQFPFTSGNIPIRGYY